MTIEVEPEVLGPEGAPSTVRVGRVQALGVVGAVLAMLTMAAALGFGLLVLFGTTLAAAALAALVWPWIFSPEFTQWVFGEPKVSFWKLFLLSLAAGAVVRLFRRQLWQRR